MLAISIVNLILSIFGITVSSIFILFWCGRYFCARFFERRMPGSRSLFFLGTVHNRGTAEHNSAGVSPLVIAYFPTITFHQDTSLPRQDAMCAVCLGEYKEEERLRMLPQCGHNFHANCIDAWLQRHATCPVCRISLQGYFVGRALAALQATQPPQPSASSQAVPSATDQVVAGANVRPLSEHTAALPPSRSTSLSRADPQCDNHVALGICSSPSCNIVGYCDSLQAETARQDEHGLMHTVERG